MTVIGEFTNVLKREIIKPIIDLQFKIEGVKDIKTIRFIGDETYKGENFIKNHKIGDKVTLLKVKWKHFDKYPCFVYQLPEYEWWLL